MHADVLSLIDPAVSDGASLPRRRFVQRSVGAGFAAAVLPALASTEVKTPLQGLDAGEVTVRVGDFAMPAYRAVKSGARGAPLILVVSEIFGVHEHIADVVRRFAHAGWFAVAPELFVRQGDAGSYGEIARLMSEVIAKVPDAQVMGDLDATVEWARTQGADTARTSITGFCWGGRITWLYAAHRPSLKAGVAWYGRLAGAATPLQPRHPLDITAHLHAPVLGLYGAADAGIPLADVERMRAALAAPGASAAAQASRVHVYADAPHAFHADYRPTYRADDARDGWARCLRWLRDHGAGPAA